MGNAAAKGAPAADLGGGQSGHRFLDQGGSLGDQRVVLYLALAGHGPDAQATVLIRTDEKEFGDVVQVNEN